MVRSGNVLLWVVMTISSATAQQFQIDINQFDSWIFQGVGNETRAQTLFASAIDLEINRLERWTSLEDSQKERIRLAGQGDIKRFFDRVEKARRDFHALGDQLNQNNINEAYQIASPLSQEVSKGLFGETSLLRKVVNGTLDDEQAEKIRVETARRKRLHTETAIKMWLAELGRRIPMTGEQREAMLQITLSNVKSIEAENRYTSYLISYRLSKMPPDKLEEILDEAQLKAIQYSFNQAKQYEAMLKQQGLLNDE